MSVSLRREQHFYLNYLYMVINDYSNIMMKGFAAGQGGERPAGQAAGAANGLPGVQILMAEGDI